MLQLHESERCPRGRAEAVTNCGFSLLGISPLCALITPRRKGRRPKVTPASVKRTKYFTTSAQTALTAWLSHGSCSAEVFSKQQALEQDVPPVPAVFALLSVGTVSQKLSDLNSCLVSSLKLFLSAQDQNRTRVFAGEAKWVIGCALLWWINRETHSPYPLLQLFLLLLLLQIEHFLP